MKHPPVLWRLFGGDPVSDLMPDIYHTIRGIRQPTAVDPYTGYRMSDPTGPDSHRPPSVPSSPKERGEIRILCMGDSTTFNGRFEERDTWPGRLERYMNEWVADGSRIVVYNGAVPGYAAQQCKRLLQSRFLELEPDIVLWREEPSIEDCLELPEVLPEGWVRVKRTLLRSRFLFLAVNLRMFAARRSGKDTRDPGWHLFNVPGNTCANGHENRFPQFVDWLHERGVNAVIGVEYLFNVNREFMEVLPVHYRRSETAGSLMGNGSLWEQLGLPYVPGWDAFASESDTDALFSDYCHFTEPGLSLQARLVSDYLRERWPEIIGNRSALAAEGEPPAVPGHGPGREAEDASDRSVGF